MPLTRRRSLCRWIVANPASCVLQQRSRATATAFVSLPASPTVFAPSLACATKTPASVFTVAARTLATRIFTPLNPITRYASTKANDDAVGECSWQYQLVRSVGEECQTDSELRRLLSNKPNFVLYDGFEPSGRMHIAQGVYKSLCVNKCTKAGGTFIFWVADWFALMNDKMGGDLERIQTVGRYLIEVWKASGMDTSRVKFLWSSEEISKHADRYWGQALDIACRTTLARAMKCSQIMGRKEELLTAAQILYPIMQCTDVFFLEADICQLGVDQRKVNMLARDYCDAAGKRLKPVILSHHMLYGLKRGQPKMSKSDPDSAIFMEDSASDVARKIHHAYCPRSPEKREDEADEEDGMHLVKDHLRNPCLDYVKYILFGQEGYVFDVEGQSFNEFEDLRTAFEFGAVSEVALKERLIEEINRSLEPVRSHFAYQPEAKALLARVTQWKKENLVPKQSCKRLFLPKVGGAAWVVFAPPPEANIHLETIWGTLRRLQLAPPGHRRLLWLQDWSARAEGRLSGSEENVRSFFNLFLHGLRSLAPDLMARVDVLWQGEMILTEPNDYWTSVINAGRSFSVDAVRSVLPDDEPLECAGQIVATMMHVGDILAVAGVTSEEGSAILPLVICSPKDQVGRHQMAARFVAQCDLPPPEIHSVVAPSLRLRGEGEGIETDATVFLTDNEIMVNQKIKKAFCEPRNVELCPPLQWVQSVLLPLNGDFVVARRVENGGDCRYTDGAQLCADFAAGALHPGDLKPSLSKALNVILERVRRGLASDKALKQSQKTLEKYIKAQTRKR